MQSELKQVNAGPIQTSRWRVDGAIQMISNQGGETAHLGIKLNSLDNPTGRLNH